MGRVKTRRAAVGGVHRVLAGVNQDVSNGRSPVLARLVEVRIERRNGRVHLVVHRFGQRDNPDPTALHKAAIPLADTNGVRGPVRNIGYSDAAIAVKNAAERFVLLTPAIPSLIASAPPPEAATVTAQPLFAHH